MDETGGGAIGIGDDEAGVVAAILLLDGNSVEMGGIHFRNEQGDIGIHAVIAGIADDGIPRAGEILFGSSGDGRIERRENKIAIEREVKTFYDKVAGGFGNGRVEMPADGFEIGR